MLNDYKNKFQEENHHFIFSVSYGEIPYDKTKAGEYTAFCSAADESDYYGLLKSISVKILVTAVNTTMLDAAITEAEAVTISNYTTSTINVFTAAKNAAEAVKQQA